MSNFNSQRPHPNDLQQKGFRTTAQAMQQKQAQKFYNQKITRRELAEFEQSYRRIIESLVSFNSWVVQNVPGLKEKYEAEEAKHKAAVEAAKAAAATPAPVPAPATEFFAGTGEQPAEGLLAGVEQDGQ